MIGGKWVVRKGRSLIYEEEEVRHSAGEELDKLIKRAN
jgi:hypothetical protein